MKVANPLIKIFVIGLITLGAAVILAYYYVTAGGRLPLSGHLYTVSAVLQDSQGLLKHADVRAAGVKVGTVSDITATPTPQGTLATVQLQLNGSYAPVYNDATVLVRQKTLVGENYIEIARGHPQAGLLRDGATLALSHDLESVPLDKILNSLDPTVRRQVRTDLQSLGAGLHHEGKHLNEFLGALQPTVHNGGVVLNVLDSQRAQLATVVSQTATVMQALANRTQDLQTLVTTARATAQAVANRNTRLQQSLIELPATLAQARASVATLAGFSGGATPVIANLRVAVENLGPVFRDLQPTAAAARRLFRDLPPFLRVADPLLTSLRRFSGAARPAVPAIEALLREANPALAYIAPYHREIGGFLENFGDGAQIENFTHEWLGRCLCPVSALSFSNYTPTEQKLVQALIRAGGLGGIANPTANPLRRPGLLPDASTPFTGSYPRLAADPPTGVKR
jgi:virulence factor Mce-like protein